ncbi:leucine-rich repeat flightless-interacting protein 2 isoform X1 [Arapaima gigas]
MQASLYDDGLYGLYRSRTPSECSWYSSASSAASSTRSSPASSSDDDSSSTVSQERPGRGRRGSVVSVQCCVGRAFLL